jgi:hypothetical protein
MPRERYIEDAHPSESHYSSLLMTRYRENCAAMPAIHPAVDRAAPLAGAPQQ